MPFPKAKIIILDDEPLMLQMLTKLLSAQGYQTYPTLDSQQALLIIKNESFDLILMDILMPKINGFEFYEQIKEQLEAENIPIIFISALQGAANKVQAFKMGAADYITKPFRSEELLARIQTHLQSRQIQQQLQAQNQLLENEIKKRKKAKKARKRAERFMAGALDALAAHIAILDNNGTIIAVNAAWRNFADKKGLMSVNYAIGANYLEVCELAHGDCATDALAVAQGIRSVILKTKKAFYLEYPCHNPETQRWFAVRVTYFEDDKAIFAVVAHENITKRRLAEEALKQTNELLFQLATMDGLTQIANRRQFDTDLNREWQQALGEQRHFSLILADIDYFKNYNDYYGHQMGDDCLQQVAQSIQLTLINSRGLVARYGGEEFAIILPQTTLAQAKHQAEIIQQNIAALNIPHAKSEVSSIITLSLGIATTLPHLEYSAEQLLNQADQALYEAKAAGRNQIVMREI